MNHCIFLYKFLQKKKILSGYDSRMINSSGSCRLQLTINMLRFSFCIWMFWLLLSWNSADDKTEIRFPKESPSPTLAKAPDS